MTKLSRNLRNLVLLSLCALCFFIGAVTVQAATYYVATTGNDASACATAQTITTPKRTIASGVACLNAGDTLYIRAGTWTQSIDTGTKVGTAVNPITIAAYPGETVTLRPPVNTYAIVPRVLTYFIFDGLVWDGVNNTQPYNFRIVDGTHDLIVRNMEFKNQQSTMIYISNATNVTIQRCRIHDQTAPSPNKSYAIYVHDGENILIEHNDIYNNPGGGLHIYPGPITGLVVRNNKIHHNNTLEASRGVGGITVYEELPAAGGGQILNTQIYNNLVYKNESVPPNNVSSGIRISSGTDGTKVWNNTVYGNNGAGLLVQNGPAGLPTNTVLQNNISYLNTGGEYVNVGSDTVADHNLTTDPSFVNATTFDFNLRESSSAIDAGAPLTNVKTDFRMNPRPQGATHDIGAYEVGDGSDLSAPLPPQGLSIQ